jgi:hypothetical protein
MPAVAPLTNNASVKAFSAPAGSLGILIWNKSIAELRLRLDQTASASGASEGVPIPAASGSTPSYYTRYFAQPLRNEVDIQIFQNSGSDITSGVGYELLLH